MSTVLVLQSGSGVGTNLQIPRFTLARRIKLFFVSPRPRPHPHPPPSLEESTKNWEDFYCSRARATVMQNRQEILGLCVCRIWFAFNAIEKEEEEKEEEEEN